MMPIRLMTYRKGGQLPALPEEGLNHSTRLFHIYEQTPGYSPILIVSFQEERPIGKLLGVIRQSVRLFPPSLIKRCEIYGCGEYFDSTIDQDELFGMMLEHLTNEVRENCFLVEVRNLSKPLFAYKHFRANGYVPINWIRVYNSLHNLSPNERMEDFRKRQIKKAIERGAYTIESDSQEDTNKFLTILRKNYASKFQKHFPDSNLFYLLSKENQDKETIRIFLVKYNDKIIGGSICLFSNGNAYLGFSGGMKKTYAWLYPNTLAIWAAIEYAHQHGYQHFEFADAGLPFKKIGYRKFILGFGGKQVSTRRWFRFRWNWINRILCRLYL